MFTESVCKFAKSHEWTFAEGGIATVGISDYAQKEISDIVFVELPKTGVKVEQGKSCAVIESVKAAADFFAPVSGTVTQGNDALADDPALVNSDPEGAGWFFKLDLSDPSELEGLMDAAAYKAFVDSL